MKGFLLGLSNGAACLAYCAPSFVPLLMGEGKGKSPGITGCWRNSCGEAGRVPPFRSPGLGRPSDPLACPSGADPADRGTVSGLLRSSDCLRVSRRFSKRWRSFAKTQLTAIRGAFEGRRLVRLPVAAGFVTGLSFCPPFLLAFTGALEEHDLVYGMLFFTAFFVGTSVFLSRCRSGASSETWPFSKRSAGWRPD